MVQETITYIKLIASEGKVLTDGNTYGKQVYLAEDADLSTWYEITDAEYAVIREQQTTDTSEE